MRVLTFFGVFMCMCVLNACSSGHSLPPLPAHGVVLAFGDSLTYGTGAAEEASYPAVLSELIGREVVNAGIPGEISAQGLARLPAILAEVSPDLLLLCHGGNDFLRQMDEAETRANVAAMIRLAQEQGISVVLIGVPQFGLFLSPADFYQALAEEFKIPYESHALSDILSNNSLKSDTVHPNALGYRVLAEGIKGVLVDAGSL